MTLLGLALAAFVGGGAAALLATRSPRWASRFGVGGALLGSALGLVPAVEVLCGRSLPGVALAWSVPGGTLALALDPLSAFFLVPVLAITAATAAYGGSYLSAEAGHKLLGPAWLWFDWLAASLVLVVTARNGLLFLIAWEAMTLTSYFLVIFHHERDAVPRAGWIYLAATHLGTAFLLVLFGLLAQDTGSLDFARWDPPHAGAFGLFALALVGFGTKAGLFPFHLWLPEAHPVAPSHVSALLSGVMIKMGVYGLLRMLSILGPPNAASGAVLLAMGLASGLFGVLLALVQHDLKRLLAYHSIENIGIIVLGVGLAWIAASAGATGVAALALAGALLHVWNHALFKSLLFLAAGAIGRSAGTQDLERLGGLLKRMPWTGATFLVGAVAICGLPPLNGFVSEFLIYAAAFKGAASSSAPSAALWAPIGGLALIGGLAAACFAKAAGVAFLGEPRSAEAAGASEVEPVMRAAMLCLAAACVALGLAGPLGLAASLGPVEQLLGPERGITSVARSMTPVLWSVGAVGACVALAALALAGLRRRVLRRRSVRIAGTWDCGFVAPSPRMQYTASSFAQPLTRLFAPVVRARTIGEGPAGTFPRPTSFASRSTDVAEGVFAGLFGAVAALAMRLRPLQAGSTQVYVLYTVLAALALLLWKLV